MFRLLVGALQLFVLVIVCVHCVAGRWLIGTLGALVRIVVLMAVAMASARIHTAGAEPSSAYYVALYAGPLLSVVVLVLAHLRRRAMPAGEAEVAANRLVMSWLAASVVDLMFVVVGVGGRLIGAAH